MSRRPHWIGRNAGGEYPSHCIYFDTETLEVPGAEGERRHRLVFGWAAYERRHRGECWTPLEWQRFETLAGFWDWVESHVLAGVRLNLFAHNLAFDARVLAMFKVLPERGWTCTQAVLEGPPTIVQWRRGRTTLRFLDTLNWWRLKLEAIGEHVGLPKLVFPGQGVTGAEADRYCRRDVEIVREVLHRWWGFLGRHDLGTAAPTLASQAFTAWRHRFMQAPVFCDTNADALEISRACYYGGRVECFRLGHIEGLITAWDVNAMFPACMYAREFPARLLTVVGRRGGRRLPEWLGRYWLAAEVELETSEPRYPERTRDGLRFPVGRFRTHLCGDELRMAHTQDHIREVYRAAVYEPAELFTEFVTWSWLNRLECQADGDRVQDWLFKILGNSLYGKFGQRGRVWRFCDVETDLEDGDYSYYDLDARVARRCRVLAGRVQRLDDASESYQSHPAIAAAVTAAARTYLWRLFEACGRELLLYCDTDSLFLRGEPAPAFARYCAPGRLGGLKRVGTWDWLRLHGPKDYETPESIIHKGVSARAVETAPGEYLQDQWSGWAGALRTHSLDAPTVIQVRKVLRRAYTKGQVLPDGSVVPLLVGSSGPGTVG